MISIHPVIIGRGMSGQTIAKSLAYIAATAADIKLLPSVFFQRDNDLGKYIIPEAKNILFIANPSGLHSATILSGVEKGFDAIVCDKPVCVAPEELESIKNITIPINVLHGYRAMWGPRTIKQMIDAAELGEIFALECHYWLSSLAQQAVGEVAAKHSWKNDIKLSGPFDVFIDLGSHVFDMFLYFMNSRPQKSSAWLSYANGPVKHRDTHVHLNLQFSNTCHAMASLSKTLHGANNDFSIVVVGTKASVTWSFLKPNEISMGCGSKTTILQHSNQEKLIEAASFNETGRLEGYVEIILQSLRGWTTGLSANAVPTFAEAVRVMECMFDTDFI